MVGTFLGFAPGAEACGKRIRMESGNRRVEIKVAKELRHGLASWLKPGIEIRVSGRAKNKRSGEIKLKADDIACRGGGGGGGFLRRAAGCIQVCGKSRCWKRGGRELYQELIGSLAHEDAEGRVRVEVTGCLGNCSRCPSICCQPEGRIYGEMDAEAALAVLRTQLRAS